MYPRTVSLKRLSRASLTLLVAFGVQAAHGAPARATQTLRAVWCCSTSCHHSTSAPAASRCCGVGQSHDDTATIAPKAAAHAAAATPALVTPALPTAESLALRRLCTGSLPGARAAPLFLLTRSLRV